MVSTSVCYLTIVAGNLGYLNNWNFLAFPCSTAPHQTPGLDLPLLQKSTKYSQKELEEFKQMKREVPTRDGFRERGALGHPSL